MYRRKQIELAKRGNQQNEFAATENSSSTSAGLYRFNHIMGLWMCRCCQTIEPCGQFDYRLTGSSLTVSGCEDSVRGRDSRDNYKQFR
jgi:hypothetical protein